MHNSGFSDPNTCLPMQTPLPPACIDFSTIFNNSPKDDSFIPPAIKTGIGT